MTEPASPHDDIDGLITLPGVQTPSGDEKAGTGEVEPDGVDPEDVHRASGAYIHHRSPTGPPDRH